MIVSRKTAVQFLRFAGVGIIGTAGHYSVLLALVELLAVHAVIATTIGFSVGAMINYTLNRGYTFASSAPHLTAVAKFVAVAIVGALINALLMALLSISFGIHYFISQILATCVVLLWNFIGNKYWTFSS